MKYSDCTTRCTGDVVKGDIILFTESVFGGSFRKPVHLGERKILAEVMQESYGAGKQQHTFTLRLIRCTGFDASEVRKKAKKNGTLRRKGRNIYRNGTLRAPRDQEERAACLREKHERGAKARAEREARRNAHYAY